MVESIKNISEILGNYPNINRIVTPIEVMDSDKDTVSLLGIKDLLVLGYNQFGNYTYVTKEMIRSKDIEDILMMLMH